MPLKGKITVYRVLWSCKWPLCKTFPPLSSLQRQTAGADGGPLRQTPGCIWHPAGYSGWDPWAALTSPALCHGLGRNEGNKMFLCHFSVFQKKPCHTNLPFGPKMEGECNECCAAPPSWPAVWLGDTTAGVMRSDSGSCLEINVSDITAPAWFLMWWTIYTASANFPFSVQ